MLLTHSAWPANAIGRFKACPWNLPRRGYLAVTEIHIREYELRGSANVWVCCPTGADEF